MAKTREMLPCPFCGARLYRGNVSWQQRKVFLHPEVDDGCFAKGVIISPASPHAAAWNRRPAPEGEANG